MSHRTKIAQSTLLKYSQEPSSYENASAEWKITSEMLDHLAPIETCQLCNQPNIRYQYQISNYLTHHVLWVGSDCITKFEITVVDEDGNLLLGKAARKHLETIKDEKRREMQLEPLRALYSVSGKAVQKRITLSAENIKNQKPHSPTKLLWLFQQLSDATIEFPANLFKVSLRSKRHQADLYRMADADRQLIWPALSPQQQKAYPQKKHEHDQSLAIQKQQPVITPSIQRFATAPTGDRFAVRFLNKAGDVILTVFRKSEDEARVSAEKFLSQRASGFSAEITDPQTDQIIRLP